MSTRDDRERADAFATLDALLDGMVEMLDPQSENGWDDGLVTSLVDESLEQAKTANIAGVIELLKIWKTALGDSRRLSLVATGAGRLGMVGWFRQLLSWCRLDLQESLVRQLLPSAISLLRLTSLTERTEEFVCQRLLSGQRQIAEFRSTPEEAEPDSRAPALPVISESSLVADDRIGEGALEIATEPTNAVSTDTLVTADPHQASVATAEDDVLPEHSSAEVDPLSADIDTCIWISTEELELALEAISNQVLPAIYGLAEADSADDGKQHLEDLGFNLGLVGNAMEMLGTPVLSRAILDMQDLVESDAPPEAETLVNWSVALVAYLESPDPDNVELLIAMAAELPAAEAGAEQAMRAEAQRIRVGLDPAVVSERKSEALDVDIVLEHAPDVLPQVLDGMLRELPGNAERLGSTIRELIRTGDPTPIDEARRVAHTLKGDANTVGVRGLANLTHSLEDLLIDLHKRPQSLTAELGSELDRAADMVEEIADYLLARGPMPTGLLEVYQSILDWSNRLVTDQLQSQSDIASAAPTASPIPQLASQAEPEPVSAPVAAVPSAADSEQREAVLSVNASTLEELQRLAGETLVMARQIDQRLGLLEGFHNDQLQQLRSSSDLISKLDDLVSLRGAALQSTVLRGGEEVDPLELDQYNELHVVSKHLSESNADHAEYQHRLDSLFMELDGLRTQQEGFHGDLQRVVQRTRMVPFEQISGRLQRITRQTSRQLDREVELQLDGTDTLVESELLDRVVEPLAHLLRNAIDHGIEPAENRQDAGKAALGTLKLSVATVADSIEIRLVDDGRGLNYEGIERKAKDLGLLSAEAQPSVEELARVILLPGFSTKSQTSHISGRGIGMDVVNQRILDLRGQLEIVSEPGRSTSITMRLPVSRTMANVIIVHGNGVIAGAVASSVERVVSLEPDSLGYSDDGKLNWMEEGQPLPVVPIETLYGGLKGRPSLPPQGNSGLLLRTSAGRRMVVSVASIGDVSSVIVKPVSPHLPSIPAVRGMTLLGDGRLAAVIDMVALADSLQSSEVVALSEFGATAMPRLPRAVIADDSLSVRRSLTQLMEDAGFEVAAARDGLAALQLIEDDLPAIVLLDLEMPKLNGLELTRYLRGRPQTKSIPILMVTSRASDKYRLQADSAGVSLMLGKPVSEDELVSNVRKLMAGHASQQQAVMEPA